MSLILHYTCENCDNETDDRFEKYESVSELESHLGWLLKARSCFEVVGIYKKDDDLTDKILNYYYSLVQKEELSNRIQYLTESKRKNEDLLREKKEYLTRHFDLLNEKGLQQYQNNIIQYERIIRSTNDQLEELKKELLNDQTNFSK